VRPLGLEEAGGFDVRPVWAARIQEWSRRESMLSSYERKEGGKAAGSTLLVSLAGTRLKRGGGFLLTLRNEIKGIVLHPAVGKKKIPYFQALCTETESNISGLNRGKRAARGSVVAIGKKRKEETPQLRDHQVTGGGKKARGPLSLLLSRRGGGG